MTQHFVPVHSGCGGGGQLKPEESRLTEFDRDLPSILGPVPSFGAHGTNSPGSPLSRSEAKVDFNVVYVNGGEDVLINNEDDLHENDESAASRGTVFAAFLVFLSAIFAKIFHGLNRCRPIASTSQRPQEASFSAVEVERIEEELRKMPKKTQKPNAPVY